jgi:TolB-like protein/protein involved in temperature-dependent protein secretion
MKRCPECRRDYFDETLTFCLDDGSRLLEGPGSDGSETAVIPPPPDSSEAATRTFNSEYNRDDQTVRRSPNGSSKLLFFGFAALIVVSLIALAGYRYFGSGGRARQIESVAVMPFVNAGGNPDLEYLSDGITESLINSLSQVATLSVKARSSVFTYKGKDVTPQQVAEDLAVQAVVNGRLQQMGDLVVLNVELVDASSGDQIWGEQYSRQLTDLVRLQSDIARDVSGKLRSRLTGAEQQRVTKNYTDNTEAYQLYLRGRHHWNRRTPEDIRKSIEFFQMAIDKDHSYALALAALAEGYILFPNYRIGTPADNYPKARNAALKALEIDGSLAEAHNALASVISNYDWKFADAEAEWRKALELNPNYASAHQWYAEFLMSMGRYREALAEMKRARELDPLSLIINAMLGIALHLDGQWEPAIEQLKKTVEIDPDFPRTRLYLAEVYQGMGRFEESADEFAKFFILNGGSAEEAARLSERVKNASRMDGETGHFREMAELMERGPGAPPAIRASYWGRARDLDKAFAILEKAYSDHDDSLLMLKDYRFDPLKSDPRYKDLIRRIGLPE